MFAYSVGRFAPLVEKYNLNKVECRKLARFAQKYYNYKFRFIEGYYDLLEKMRKAYVEDFLHNSTLPYEVKRDIALITRIEREKLTSYEVITESPL